MGRERTRSDPAKEKKGTVSFLSVFTQGDTQRAHLEILVVGERKLASRADNLRAWQEEEVSNSLRGA